MRARPKFQSGERLVQRFREKTTRVNGLDAGRSPTVSATAALQLHPDP